MVRFEPFTAGHVAGIVDLCAAEGWPSWSTESVLAAFAAPGVLAIVDLEGEEVVGVAELLTDGAVVAYLALLVVAERARRRGVGRRLVEELFARSGLSRIDLLAEERSTPFYESFAHRAKPGYRLYRDV